MYQVLNAMRMQASISQNSKYFSQIGTISSYDNINFVAKVLLQPATDELPALETGYLPIASPWVGNNWGMFAAPAVGALCTVHYQEGSLNNGFISLMFFSNENRPLNVPSEELWLFHKTGSYLKLTNDGNVLINGQTEIDITAPTINITTTLAATIKSDVIVNIQAPAVNLGDTTELSSSLTGLLTGAAIAKYNSHTHADPQGGITGPPSQLFTTADLTNNTKAT